MNDFIVTYVKPGETLSEIAARYGVSTDALQRWNRIENPDLVLVGQRIVVHKTTDSSGLSASESAVLETVSDPQLADDSRDILIGGAIVLGILLLFLLLRRKRSAVAPISHTPATYQPQNRISTGQDSTLQRPTTSVITGPTPRPEVNDGERLVSSELMSHYPDWILIDDVMLPSVSETTQIDHILVAPSAVFLIETKEMGGWIFGRPAEQEWTQSFPAGYWSRKAGIKSKPFKFYNPILQNEGHAKALIRLRIINWRRLRPIVVFVGDAELKTADKFRPFEEHEKIATQDRTWRMRGVICMSMTELFDYMDFSVNASSVRDMTHEEMEAVCAKVRSHEIPMTAQSRAQHIDFVQSIREKKSQQSKRLPPKDDRTT